MELVRLVTADVAGVEVAPFNGLLVDFAEQQRVEVIIRGLRAFSDFEFEFQMALTNRTMKPNIETLFLMPKQDYSYGAQVMCAKSPRWVGISVPLCLNRCRRRWKNAFFKIGCRGVVG